MVQHSEQFVAGRRQEDRYKFKHKPAKKRRPPGGKLAESYATWAATQTQKQKRHTARQAKVFSFRRRRMMMINDLRVRRWRRALEMFA